jgi:hypothetical protein
MQRHCNLKFPTPTQPDLSAQAAPTEEADSVPTLDTIIESLASEHGFRVASTSFNLCKPLA